MLPKPDHLTNEFGVQFQDQSIADVYDKRPPYPAETLDILLRLIVDQPAHVLELGCGTGDIARRLAPRVTQLDAVDPSAAMLAVGKTLSGGEHTHLRWIQQTAEEFTAASPYALVIAA